MSVSRVLCGISWICLLTTFSGRQAIAQLDAPGAFSDFSGCAHHTCTWVPGAVHKTFTHGELSYRVDGGDDDKGGEFFLYRGKKELLRAELKDLSASTSVVWSPDGQSFAISWSDGGAIGNFHVRVFHLDGDKITEWPSGKIAFQAFKARHWCPSRGDNIQAYNWSSDSRLLVLVLSVYPTGDCGLQLGHTEGYLVDSATGRVREVWNHRKLSAYLNSHPE